jgi:hypothetical protein
MEILQKIGLAIVSIAFAMVLLQYYFVVDLTLALPSGIGGTTSLFSTYILLYSIIAVGIALFFMGLREKGKKANLPLK